MALREGTFQRFASLKGLRVLEIQHHPLEQDALAALESLSQLERLVLTGPIQDADLRSLANLRELTTIVLRGSHVTDAGLAHLSGLRAIARPDPGRDVRMELGAVLARCCRDLEAIGVV